MAPTKVGIIGLSASGWAPAAHLPYLLRSPAYEITAICNSSVASSQAAIEKYSLPSSTKAYGDPEDIAKDASVDLVVCAVRVDRHLATISPSLKAGKDVFVEWPLGASLTEARELLRLKNEGGVKRAIVGLQARQAPIIKAVKSLVRSGRVGKVLSSTWTGYAVNGGESVDQSLEHMGRREVGANLVSIHFGHAFDYVQFGYGFQTPPKTLLANRRPFVKMLDHNGRTVEEVHRKTSDDTIFLHGTLSNDSIPVSFALRGGMPFPSTPGLEWRIYGEEGEVRVTAAGIFLQIGYADMKIQVAKFGGVVEEVQVKGDEFDAEGYGLVSKNVGRIYRCLERGEREGLCGFDDAVQRHELIDEMYRENGIEV
ncbi:NAD-P-binding protein [Cadophora sp. DSE1049]|nr:NAD-P-binding protein [Cadophora sp. DSE1049]